MSHRSLMSPRTRTAMETAVWKAEKHPASVERFLLAGRNVVLATRPEETLDSEAKSHEKSLH